MEERGGLVTDTKDKRLAERVRRLAETAASLHEGRNFPITRLTVIKALCREPRDATLFTVHLAVLARDQIVGGQRPQHLDQDVWERHKALAVEAVGVMQEHLAQASAQSRLRLADVLERVHGMQNKVVPVAWGVARVVDDRFLLIIEGALQCLLSPQAGPQLAYQTARQFAERYDPRYGTGLIPASAPFVEEIAAFWSRHHLGRAPAELPGPKPRKPPRAAAPPKLHVPRAAVRPATSSFSTTYPAITRWVKDCGWVEIGYSEGTNSFIRALDIGGMIWEGKTTYPSVDAALAELEKRLAKWIAENL
jgi:hypothetical protein